MFGKKRTDVPETVTDDTWTRIQRGAAKSGPPLVDGPWVDPKLRAKGAAWKAARGNSASN